MQFKQYPSYKDSGVEWLGEVPSHWDVKKIKRLSPVKRGASPRPINDLKYFDDNGEYAWVRISDVTRCNGYLFDTEQKLSELGASHSVKLEPESMFLSIAATVGKPCITKIKTCIHDGFVYFPKLKKHKELLFNIFDSKLCFVGLGKLGTQLNLNSETVEDIYISIPPDSEEEKVIKFLSLETTKIDTLIAKQEKLIELLEEQRKSIISHAVTKGLNPNAPMKDSGVEWLGEVPNDWNFSRLDAVSKIVRGNSAFSKMDLLESGKYVALQYGKTYKVNEINESFGSYVNQEFFKKSQITEFGDIILISTSETLEDLGHSCFYARHDVGLIGGEQFLLKPKNQNFGKYIYYATKAFSSYLQRYATGLKVFRFNLDDLKKIYIPDISLVEQQKIAEFLDKETARIDISVLKQKSLIEKLKEYRASIISHAVTGKIDVREFGA